LSEFFSQKLIIQPIAYCNIKPQTKRERLRAVEVFPASERGNCEFNHEYAKIALFAEMPISIQGMDDLGIISKVKIE
jgi:hypothetical protein